MAGDGALTGAAGRLTEGPFGAGAVGGFVGGISSDVLCIAKRFILGCRRA